ncbi:cysteine proteinase [Gymnopus androsaceus JB14]|uniref:ubiquitinyl hydrolase 1 n=1 Tax=Gymnopus androsaceus JB14 TaxID=1447944 RepID=A0A6A4INL9_9AGAR|nr:cysteine proteinase [Gymnopus androsaceus JB14]
MLASPLFPSTQTAFSQLSSEDSRQYRPSKDLEAFNSLLPPPVEFVEGSSSDALAVPEGKYEPINVTPKRNNAKTESHDKPKSGSNNSSSTTPSKPSSTAKTRSLYTGEINLSWPPDLNNIGKGLFNTGNTCFLNSSLQCLLHTPPLLNIIFKHSRENCPSKNKFCMSCALRSVAQKTYKGNNGAFSPSEISGQLQVIAKQMRKGRQEDSHEFIRYAVDALQKSCLAGLPPKIDHKLAETTWVHKLFGGRLRSRVTCQSCHFNSDTFDSILDLSLDIHNSHHLKDALRKFVAPDYLKGSDKYKCEKCKKPVNAAKRFTIHDAPVVLMVHLKRFSPLGQKIGHMVSYDEQLHLGPFMSENQYGPHYSLYGAICHAGGGPHSGHYFAYVKGISNKWYEMNDESVTPASSPIRQKTSYILFYIKNKGQKLESAVKLNTPLTNGSSLPFTPTQVQKSGMAAQMKKKRPREEGTGEDKGVKVDKPFIGPLLPSQAESSEGGSPSLPKRPKLNSEDPQASAIKRKIESARASGEKSALSNLAGYGSEEEEDVGEVEDKLTETSSKLNNGRPPSPPPLFSPRPPTPATKPSGAIPPSSFYGTPASAKQKHSSVRMDKGNRFNPYKLGGNKYGKKHNRKSIRGL